MYFDRKHCRIFARVLAYSMVVSTLFAAAASQAFFIAEPQNESEYRQGYAVTTNAERALGVQLNQCTNASKNHACLTELSTLASTICNVEDVAYDYDACSAKQQACQQTRTQEYSNCVAAANGAYNNTPGLLTASRALTDVSNPTLRSEAQDEIYWCQTYHSWSCKDVTEANALGQCLTLQASCNKTPETYLKERLDACARGVATNALTKEQGDKCVRNANLNYNNSERRIRVTRDVMDASTDALIATETTSTDNADYYYQLDPGAPVTERIYVGDGEDSLSNALCRVIRIFLGTTGRAIASIGIFFMGVGLFFGKVSWGSALVIATSIMGMYGSIDIVQWFTGYRACSIVNTPVDGRSTASVAGDQTASYN